MFNGRKVQSLAPMLWTNWSSEQAIIRIMGWSKTFYM